MVSEWMRRVADEVPWMLPVVQSPEHTERDRQRANHDAFEQTGPGGSFSGRMRAPPHLGFAELGSLRHAPKANTSRQDGTAASYYRGGLSCAFCKARYR